MGVRTSHHPGRRKSKSSYSIKGSSHDFCLDLRSTTEASAQTSEVLTYEAEIQTAELKSIHVRNSVSWSISHQPRITHADNKYVLVFLGTDRRRA